jgi:hypothetical protein
VNDLKSFKCEFESHWEHMPTHANKPSVTVTKIHSTKASMSGWPFNLGQLRKVVSAFDGMDDEVELTITRTEYSNGQASLDFIAPPHPSVR